MWLGFGWAGGFVPFAPAPRKPLHPFMESPHRAVFELQRCRYAVYIATEPPSECVFAVRVISLGDDDDDALAMTTTVTEAEVGGGGGSSSGSSGANAGMHSDSSNNMRNMQIEYEICCTLKRVRAYAFARGVRVCECVSVYTLNLIEVKRIDTQLLMMAPSPGFRRFGGWAGLVCI